MRIGIYIKEFNKLENWELRIIEGLQNNPKFELCLCIQDDVDDTQNKFIERISDRSIKSNRQSFSNLVLNIQIYLERKFFFKKINTVNKEEILQYLKTVHCIKVSANNVNGVVNYSPKELDKIDEYNLDLLINLQDYVLNSTVARSVKYGVYYLSYLQHLLSSKRYLGIWEIIGKQPAIEINLKQQIGTVGEISLHDSAYLSWHWSLVKTTDLVLEGSVSLLFKNLRLLRNKTPINRKIEQSSEALRNALRLKDVLYYCLKFYTALLKKMLKEIKTNLLGTNYQRWTLFLGKGDFLKSDLSQLKPSKLPKDEFWADPFLFEYKNEYYVFFETYCYKTKKGKLSCGKLENENITNVEDILDLEYHLSYPFVFVEDGEIFLMPETMDNNRLEIYVCKKFPNEWELFTTAFEGELVADASFYNDENNQKWLFVNKKEIKSLPLNSELFIYRVDSVALNTLEPHALNPVIIDSRIGRNGGAVFKYGKDLFRPSQRNVDGIYGRALNINKINELTINSYKEEVINIVEPDFMNGLTSIHHLHQIDGLFVFDAAFEK